MPKPTFLNLPEEKRSRIVEHCLDEFAANPYGQASLSRIVARAGIAKGSVYQYFDDKLDLYRWLILEEMPRRKMATLTVNVPPPEQGLFRHLEAIAAAGLRGAASDPRSLRLGARLMELSDEPGLNDLHERLQGLSTAWMRALLTAAMERGELREDLDLDLTVPLVNAVLGLGFSQAIVASLGMRMSEIVERPDALAGLTEARIQQIAREATEFVRRAIGRSKG